MGLRELKSELMEKESLLQRFNDRAEKIVNDTSDIGWGFHEYLADVFYEFYTE